MKGSEIGQMKYIDGHSNLGLQTIPVTLVAYPSNLTIHNKDTNRPLFSILWENFENVWRDTIEKRGLAYTGSFFASLIPFVDNTNLAETYYIGMYISYWDEDIRRKQQVFFYTFSRDRAEEYCRLIMAYRDSYFHSAGRHSRPRDRDNDEH